MSEYDIPELNNKELREFGLVTGGMVAGLFGLVLPWLFGFNYPVWPWIVFGVLSLWGLIFPNSLQPVYKVWMRVGGAIGWVMNRVVLSIIFFGIFMPVGLIMRIVGGNDPMNRRFDHWQDSYRIDCDPNRVRKMGRPF